MRQQRSECALGRGGEEVEGGRRLGGCPPASLCIVDDECRDVGKGRGGRTTCLKSPFSFSRPPSVRPMHDNSLPSLPFPSLPRPLPSAFASHLLVPLALLVYRPGEAWRSHRPMPCSTGTARTRAGTTRTSSRTRVPRSELARCPPRRELSQTPSREVTSASLNSTQQTYEFDHNLGVKCN